MTAVVVTGVVADIGCADGRNEQAMCCLGAMLAAGEAMEMQSERWWVVMRSMRT